LKSRNISDKRYLQDSKIVSNESFASMAIKKNGSTIEFGRLARYEDSKVNSKGGDINLSYGMKLQGLLESQYRFANIWCRDGDPNIRCRVVVTGNPPTTMEWRVGDLIIGRRLSIDFDAISAEGT
jgi:hypothetical protein